MKIHPESPNKEAVPLVRSVFNENETRIRELLPELSANLSIYVYDEHIIPEVGVGGRAYSRDIMSISVDTTYSDKERQRSALGDTMLHEGYHMVQGATGDETRIPQRNLLDAAIYEGCASLFEKKYGSGHDIPWSDYSMHSDAELNQWKEALTQLYGEDVWNTEEWERLFFYDDRDKQRWKAYKVGAWLVERHIKATGEDIRDLRLMTAADIL